MTTQKSTDGAGIHNTATSVDEHDQTAVDPVLQGALGKKLRESYQEVVAEAVPEKFLTLLAELRKKETDSGDQQS